MITNYSSTLHRQISLQKKKQLIHNSLDYVQLITIYAKKLCTWNFVHNSTILSLVWKFEFWITFFVFLNAASKNVKSRKNSAAHQKRPTLSM